MLRFLVIFHTVLLLADVYSFFGLKRVFPSFSKKFAWGYWAVSFVFLFGLFGFFSLKRAGVVLPGGTLLFGGFVVLYLTKVTYGIWLLLGDSVKKGVGLFQKKEAEKDVPQSESRRDFVATTGLAVAGIPFGAMSFGILSGAHDYQVYRQRVVIPNLPKAFDGIRIGQLSDIHSGSFFNKQAVMGGVEMLNAERPDLVCFTGDLVNDRAEEVKEYFDVFEKVKADMGVYSVLGNHDYGMYVKWNSEAEKQKNFSELLEAHRRLGWDLLLDENRKLTVDGEQLALLGVENWGKGFIQRGNMKKALEGTEEIETKILLSHDPSHWDAEVRKLYSDVDLMLAGHTHGMQFGVKLGDSHWSPAEFRYKQWGGLYQEGKQQLYVNRGFGYIGFPGRVGMAPEITILELVRA